MRQILEVRERDAETQIILVYLTHNASTPYVTWVRRKDAPADTFWGHYHVSLDQALNDFRTRS